MAWLAIPAAIVIFLLIVIARALDFRPRPLPVPAPIEANADKERAAAHLAAMVRCKTVSSRQAELTDGAEFEKFRGLLKELYPCVHEASGQLRVGPSGILYRIKGKSDKKPSVFMAHYDVVPADGQAWEKPPFAGALEDGVLWGRGTLDTKITLMSAMEAAENLLAQGFEPENDVYLAFSGDEEIAGPSAPAMVDWFEKRGIAPALVLDEGGAVVSDIFPGLRQPCALIGIAEKGMLDVELSVETHGGHASAPPPRTSIGALARAVTAIEGHPFKGRLTKPVAEMFDTLGRRCPFAFRLIFANLWCFLPLLYALGRKKGGELNALLRTTCAFTMMAGSNATNVLPPKASMIANLRLLNHTPEEAIAYLESTADNPEIRFRKLHGMGPSRVSDTACEGWEKLRNAVMQTWPEALVSPYIMVACSDSRHYCRISPNVYRYSAMALTKEERGMIHGDNERIPVEKIAAAVEFYIRLMKQC
jgi:carboxypeptidase PM20D1